MSVATKDDQLDWVISSNAVDRLHFFERGLSSVMLRMARELAEERAKQTNVARVRVDGRDIEKVAGDILEQILAQENLPQQVKSDIREMDICLPTKGGIKR